jgi:hypothetical protein
MSEYYNLLSITLRNGYNHIVKIYKSIPIAKKKGKWINILTGYYIKSNTQNHIKNQQIKVFSDNPNFPIVFIFNEKGSCYKTIAQDIITTYVKWLKEFDEHQNYEQLVNTIELELQKARNISNKETSIISNKYHSYENSMLGESDEFMYKSKSSAFKDESNNFLSSIKNSCVSELMTDSNMLNYSVRTLIDKDSPKFKIDIDIFKVLKENNASEKEIDLELFSLESGRSNISSSNKFENHNATGSNITEKDKAFAYNIYDSNNSKDYSVNSGDGSSILRKKRKRIVKK